LYYCLYYCLFILCVFLLNLRYFLCYHVMVNKVVYIMQQVVVTARAAIQDPYLIRTHKIVDKYQLCRY